MYYAVELCTCDLDSCLWQAGEIYLFSISYLQFEYYILCSVQETLYRNLWFSHKAVDKIENQKGVYECTKRWILYYTLQKRAEANEYSSTVQGSQRSHQGPMCNHIPSLILSEQLCTPITADSPFFFRS